MTENHSPAVASPHIVDILEATGMTVVQDAYAHPAFERWHRRIRYLLYSAERQTLSGVRDLVHLDVIDLNRPGYRQTVRLCEAVPLLEAMRVFLEAIAQEADA